METIKARPLTLIDFANGLVVNGMEVYWRREHAGDVTFDPAVLEAVHTPQIFAEEPQSLRGYSPIGDGRFFRGTPSATVQSKYGSITGISSRLTDLDIFVADEEGEEIPLTPEYGSMVTVTVTMPGVTPQELQEHLGVFMKNFSTRARVTNVHAKPLADRRVNVYESNGGKRGPALALNILEGEGYLYYNGACMVDEVSRTEFERNMVLLRQSLLSRESDEKWADQVLDAPKRKAQERDGA